VRLPVTSLHTTSFPNFAFRSPNIVTASHLEIRQLQTVNLKENSFSLTILSSTGAYALISVTLLYFSSILNLHIFHYMVQILKYT